MLRACPWEEQLLVSWLLRLFNWWITYEPGTEISCWFASPWACSVMLFAVLFRCGNNSVCVDTAQKTSFLLVCTGCLLKDWKSRRMLPYSWKRSVWVTPEGWKQSGVMNCGSVFDVVVIGVPVPDWHLHPLLAQQECTGSHDTAQPKRWHTHCFCFGLLPACSLSLSLSLSLCTCATCGGLDPEEQEFASF